ncbi:unnamed protein product [Effrenium voratum]|uniref:Transmembrane protein n=1 Tax=Effrenium voratum TaxID=2562239 RepID=A0AA36HN87_9DINO|nr:unnamed protein product [Effrenium voratum]
MSKVIDESMVPPTLADDTRLKDVEEAMSVSPDPPMASPISAVRSGLSGALPLQRMKTKGASREVLGYSQLSLQESAYENAFLLPLISGRFFGKSAFLLLVNFILQYSVAYLLYRRTTLTRSVLRASLFGNGEDSSSTCWQTDETGIMCTADEVFYGTAFSRLDENGDGKWTFEEASKLDSHHLQTTGRRLNITQVYKNVLHQMRKFAGSRVTNCDVNHDVQAFDISWGYWEPARISNITSEDYIVVNYNDPAKQDELARYLEPHHVRKKLEGVIYACSVPKCVDMDNGATDASEATCRDYNGFDACSGHWDDDDFDVNHLCCTCGGGSKRLALTGFDHLPVALPLEAVSELRAFRLCMQEAIVQAQQDICIINFTSIPRAVYEEEIEQFARFCVAPEADICSNLGQRGLLPELNLNITSAVPLFLKVVGIGSPADLTQENVCRKAVSLFCPSIFTIQSTLHHEQRSVICGRKSAKVTSSDITVTYATSNVYEDATFGLTSMMFQGFLFLIVFLWGLASVAEFRSILVWWNVLLALPTCHVAHSITEKWSEGEECVLDVTGIPNAMRILTIGLNLLPRSMLQCCIFIVGIQYLLSVRNISDLILNSLALTFLVTVDEMLFAAFAGAQNAVWIQSAKPVQGRSFGCVDWILQKTHIPLGMFIFFPILIWETYFLVSNKVTTDQLAQATYCLCDLKGDTCFAPEFLRAL